MDIDIDQPLKLFYFCASQDEDTCNELDRHLTMMKRRGEISTWSNFDVSAGSNTQKEIDKRLENSDIALLFVSPHLIGNDEYYNLLLQILDLYEKGLINVIPIHLRSTDIKGTLLNDMRSLPIGKKTIADFGWERRDLAFWDVKEGIDKVVKELLSRRKVKAEKKKRESETGFWEVAFCDRKEIEKLFALESDSQSIYTYIMSQEPTIYDPLSQQSICNWSQGDRGVCNFFFADNAYHMKLVTDNLFAVGYANIPDFDNLAFQVKMTVLSGGGGGMILRANTIDPTGYRFFFGCEGLDFCNGKFFGRVSDSLDGRLYGNYRTRAKVRQTYVLTAVAYGSNFLLFIDNECKARVNDSFLTFGKIGLMAVGFAKHAHVLFSEAKIWNLSGKPPY